MSVFDQKICQDGHTDKLECVAAERDALKAEATKWRSVAMGAKEVLGEMADLVHREYCSTNCHYHCHYHKSADEALAAYPTSESHRDSSPKEGV